MTQKYDLFPKHRAMKFVLLFFFLLPFIRLTASPGVDTAQNDVFKTANQLIEKKKFATAATLMDAYSASHPTDVNAFWMEAKLQYWMHRYAASSALYQKAIQLQPKNEALRFDYAATTLQSGNLRRADPLINNLIRDNIQPAKGYELQSKLYYWRGDYKPALTSIAKSLQYPHPAESAKELRDAIEMAKAPKITLGACYTSDNQPLQTLLLSLNASAFLSKYFSPYVSYDNYQFPGQQAGNAQCAKIGNTMLFPLAGLTLRYGLGIVKYPLRDSVGLTWNFALQQKITANFDAALSVDYLPYFDTKASLDTVLPYTRIIPNINWHTDKWSAQAAYRLCLFPDNNRVFSLYGWIFFPQIKFSPCELKFGLSTAYSNAYASRYAPTQTLPEILANYPNLSVSGAYNPYFTPNNMYTNLALCSFTVTCSKRITLSAKGDLGYGSIQNPYLFLNKNSAGTVYFDKSYSTESFLPADASAALNYNGKSFLCSVKYQYQSTYFFSSNSVAVTLTKGFWNEK
jgi:hypothetical protein